MLFHCAQRQPRVGHLGHQARVVDGWTKEKALAEAETIGLTQEPMRKWVEEYLAKISSK